MKSKSVNSFLITGFQESDYFYAREKKQIH